MFLICTVFDGAGTRKWLMWLVKWKNFEIWKMGPEKQSPKNTELYAKFSKKILGRKNRNFPDHWVKKTEH